MRFPRSYRVARWLFGATFVGFGLLVAGPRCVVPDMLFVREPVDLWPKALTLGAVGEAREVYALARPGARAHYYVLQAAEGERVQVELSVPTRPRAGRAQLKMALIGPGLPQSARMPDGARPLPQDGVVWGHPAVGTRAPALDGTGETRYVVRQALEARAPRRGRYVLVVTVVSQEPGGVPYRLSLPGACEVGVGGLLRAPLAWFQADYFVAPARAIGRALLVAAGLAAILGLWYLGWMKRVTAEGGFAG